MAEEMRTCPYCQEEIKADATRCKYCRSQLQAVEPGHGGTCPYCKEAIHPEAIKCRHCGAMVGPGSCEGCGGAETLRAAGPAPAGLMPAMSEPPGQLGFMAPKYPFEPKWKYYQNIHCGSAYGRYFCCVYVPILTSDGTKVPYPWYCWQER